MATYSTQQGDTLDTISKNTGVSADSLFNSNTGLSRTGGYGAGVQIKIPDTIPASTFNNAPATLAIPNIPTPVVPEIKSDSALEQAKQYVAQIQPEVSQAEKDRQTFVQQYKDLLDGPTKEAETAQLYKDTGINDLVAKINDYTAQITAIDDLNEANKLAIGQNVGGVTVAGVQNEEARINRESAIKKLNISASLAAVQGKFNTAKSLVDQAITVKYADQQAKIDRVKAFLELNKDDLGREDKKQTQILNERQRILDEKKANDKAIGDMIINATPFAPAAQIEKAKLAKTPVEAAIALGKYSGDYLGNLVKYSTINKNNADIAKTAAEIKKLETPLPVVAANGSNAAFTANLLNSAVNKESLAVAEREKISKAFAVTNQLGALAKTLAQDQTSYFGGRVRNLMADIGQDAEAGAVQAQITALVPQVARGIYGEVGVLTDADVNNYKKVIPNLTSPTDQNKAVTALTLTALRNGVKSNLEVAAASKLDVSGFVPLYNNLTTQINKINDDIGYSDVQVKNYADLNPQVRPMVEELIKSGKTGSEILTVLGVEL